MTPTVRAQTPEYEWLPASDPDALEPASAPAGQPLISACIVARNEEATIERCLESLRDVADEIVLVHDGPCADRTLEIAARFGCRITVAPMYGHSEHHTPLAYEQARGEWLLGIDADEFLSDELRKGLRALVGEADREDVNGYAFFWPHWNGERYVSERGPFKLACFRRRATRLVGVIHSQERVDGRVRRIALRLDHRPHGPRRRMSIILAHWRRRARLHARELLRDLNEIPRFNYAGRVQWSRRREWINRWSPLLIIPAGLQTFLRVFVALHRELGLTEGLRFALLEGIYRAMVTAYVARYRYLSAPA